MDIAPDGPDQGCTPDRLWRGLRHRFVRHKQEAEAQSADRSGAPVGVRPAKGRGASQFAVTDGQPWRSALFADPMGWRRRKPHHRAFETTIGRWSSVALNAGRGDVVCSEDGGREARRSTVADGPSSAMRVDVRLPLHRTADAAPTRRQPFRATRLPHLPTICPTTYPRLSSDGQEAAPRVGLLPAMPARKEDIPWRQWASGCESKLATTG